MATKTYAELQKQIAKLQNQAERMRKGSFDKAVGQIRDLMEKNEISIEQLTEALSTKGKRGRKQAKAHSTAKPKYQSPSDPTLTWSGRGRKPKWVQKWVDGGNDLEKLLIR